MAGTKVLNKRALIIAAAGDLFAKQSFEKTTIEEIAKAVPMSKGTLYSEFTNKEEIMFEICHNHCGQVLDMMSELSMSASGNFIECAKKMLMKTVMSINEKSQNVHTPEVLVYISDKVMPEMSGFFKEQQSQINGLLKKAIIAGEISPDTDILQVSETLMTVMTAYLPPFKRFLKEGRPSKKALEKDFGLFLDLFFDGLKTSGS